MHIRKHVQRTRNRINLLESTLNAIFFAQYLCSITAAVATTTTATATVCVYECGFRTYLYTTSEYSNIILCSIYGVSAIIKSVLLVTDDQQ